MRRCLWCIRVGIGGVQTGQLPALFEGHATLMRRPLGAQQSQNLVACSLIAGWKVTLGAELSL